MMKKFIQVFIQILVTYLSIILPSFIFLEGGKEFVQESYSYMTFIIVFSFSISLGMALVYIILDCFDTNM